MGESGRGSGREQGPLKRNRTILEAEIALADEELERPWSGLLMSGIIAGMGIGASLLLLAVMLDAPVDRDNPFVGLMIGSAYAVGFIIVIMGHTDLFTEYTTLAILPVLTGQATVAQLGRLWTFVFVGNIIGGAAVALLLAWLGPALGATSHETMVDMAMPLVEPGAAVILASAALAGWFMGMLSWLIAAARETVSQILLIWVVALVIAMGHLHHAIVGSAEIIAAMPLTDALGLGDYGRFLLLATTGNAVGGVIFAVMVRISMVAGDT